MVPPVNLLLLKVRKDKVVNMAPFVLDHQWNRTPVEPRQFVN